MTAIPRRMRHLPLDKHGRVCPWFIAWVNGQPDHRLIGPGKIECALRYSACWLCGETLGNYKVFVLGPMCTITRTTAEPPSHRDCAEYAVRACPFLTTPAMRRRERSLPEGHRPPPGLSIPRNPGVIALWVTYDFEVFPDPDGRTLLSVGDPVAVSWWAEGRQATRGEVLASVESGLPALRAEADAEGTEAVADLLGMYAAALELLPREAA
ncbi:hypothetical protein [Acrocarpospora catenulata]|uniref:hypothetical protein n=1 Tax=Acrocarpospora catenulata TaxID=2836182 RepID=UPI001BDA84E9|nr:hypothetical protein [Acrocarpospora catenulata]